MSTLAGLTAKPLLKDDVPMLICVLKSVRLFCVSNRTKGVVSAVECGDAHGGGKEGGVSYTGHSERMQKAEGSFL